MTFLKTSIFKITSFSKMILTFFAHLCSRLNFFCNPEIVCFKPQMYQTAKIKLGHTNGGEDGQIQPQAKVDAFLNEIEGETLGQMLEYLSSELDSSEDSEVVRKRRSQQIDHVFCEITKA